MASASATVNIRMPREVKDGFESACADLGMSMTTAFNVFARAVARERRIPFEIAADPFYSKANMEHLERSFAQLDAGLYQIHDLIEDADD